MKKKFLLFGAVLGLGLCIGLGTSSNYVPAFAEGEEEPVVTEPAPTEEEPEPEPVPEPVVETYTIVLAQPEHGKVVIAEEDLEGEVGKEVVIDIQPSMFYLINSVTVNGTALVESETTKGIYVFKPVAGENKLAVDITTDSALLEEFNVLSQQVKNRDWASIFSVETVTRLVAILLNSSLLVAIVAYFIRDKRLSAAVEKKVEETMQKLVPDQTKDAVIKAVNDKITPIFEENKAEMMKMMQALAVFSKCMALAQENNAESRKAILDELTSLEVGDMATIAQIKEYIHKEISAKEEEYKKNMAAINKIEEKHSAVVGDTKEELKNEHTEELKYDGTEI